MGLLDDAIREHLDLKRKHGSPEQELRRQEDEALGPARREVVPAAEASEADAAESDEGSAAIEPGSEPLGTDSTGSEARPEAGEPAVGEEDPSAGELAYEESTAREPGIDPEPVEREPAQPDTDELFAADTLEPEADHPPSEPSGDTPPRGFEAVDADDDEDDSDADVLEDTPDFLQETPEHDRLWFEQKPPRDFDFD